MSYLLRCSSGVQFGGVGGHICVFVFFFARECVLCTEIFFSAFFILLWGGSAGVKFFLKFFFFARNFYFFSFFFCARVSGWVSHRGVSHWGVDPGDRWGVGGSILGGIGGPSFWGVFMVLMIFMFLMNFDVFMSFF